jgi:type VI secretion system protein ImpK
MSSSTPQAKFKDENEERSVRGENLALSYQGLFTGIVRIQSGRQHVTDAETFRKRTKAALEEVQRDVVKSGYDGADVQETHFAVVAFLDSVILNSSETIRPEWERQTLQADLFGQNDAGTVFFEKLERFRSRRDSQQLADVLEVYLLCLLLGFEGRYSGGLRGELYSITERLRARIEDIRGKSRRITPEAVVSLEAPPPTKQAVSRGLPYGLIMLGAVIVTVLLFAAAKWNLWWMGDQVGGKLS